MDYADIAREAIFDVALYADYRQSQGIAKRPDLFETNVILGEHPSHNKVTTYFISAAIIHAVIVEVLPSKWRGPFQYLSIAVEAGSIGINFHHALKF